MPTRDELTLAWGDSILAGLKGRAKALFAVGRFVAIDNGRAVFALPNPAHRDQCLPVQRDVEAALAAHFGRPVPLTLTADADAAAAPPAPSRAPSYADDESTITADDLEDASGLPDSPADRVKLAFPGAEEVEGQG